MKRTKNVFLHREHTNYAAYVIGTLSHCTRFFIGVQPPGAAIVNLDDLLAHANKKGEYRITENGSTRRINASVDSAQPHNADWLPSRWRTQHEKPHLGMILEDIHTLTNRHKSESLKLCLAFLDKSIRPDEQEFLSVALQGAMHNAVVNEDNRVLSLLHCLTSAGPKETGLRKWVRIDHLYRTALAESNLSARTALENWLTPRDIFNITKMELDKNKALSSIGNRINTKDELGKTALIYAIEYDDISSVTALLKNGADPRIGHNKTGSPTTPRTPLGYARQEKISRGVRAIIKQALREYADDDMPESNKENKPRLINPETVRDNAPPSYDPNIHLFVFPSDIRKAHGAALVSLDYMARHRNDLQAVLNQDFKDFMGK